MLAIEITQQQAARLPFRSRYPSAKMVAGLLGHAGLLRPLEALRVVDLTYGQGIWWDALPQAAVAGYDVKQLSWVRRPRCFWQAPAWTWRYYIAEIEKCLGGHPNVIAVDPPWQTTRRGREPGGRYHYRVSRAFGSPQMILDAAAAAATYWHVPVLVHYKEQWIPDGFNVLVEAWWRPFLYRAGQDYRTWWGMIQP